VTQDGLVSPVPFRLYVNDMTTLSRHVQLALYADGTALTSHLTGALATSLQDYHRLEAQCGALGKATRCDRIPRPDQSRFSDSQYGASKQDSTLG
jgi:hypothetical protein